MIVKFCKLIFIRVIVNEEEDADFQRNEIRYVFFSQKESNNNLKKS